MRFELVRGGVLLIPGRGNVGCSEAVFWDFRKIWPVASARSLKNYDQKANEIAEAETKLRECHTRTASSSPKPVKTITMRAESLGTTDVDFFKTPPRAARRSPKHLNVLAAQLRLLPDP